MNSVCNPYPSISLSPSVRQNTNGLLKLRPALAAMFLGSTFAALGGEPPLWNRPDNNSEAANTFTTYFEWDLFAGNNPYLPDVANVGPADASLVASGNYILTSTGNIYGLGGEPGISLTLPNYGVGQSGFTTLLIQADIVAGSLGTASGFTLDVGGSLYDPIASSGTRHYFQIENNAASYGLTFSLNDHTSLAKLSIDTVWSPVAIDLSGDSIFPEQDGGDLEPVGHPGFVAGTSYSSLGFGYKDIRSPSSFYGSLVNNSGTAAGVGVLFVGGASQGQRAVRWNSAGNVVELGNLGTSSSGAVDTARTYGVNDGGQVVGSITKYVDGADVGNRAVRWDPSGAAVELENLGQSTAGITSGSAYDISESGIAVGVSTLYEEGASRGSRAVRWDANGDATILGHLGTNSNGVTQATARSINEAGVVVGNANVYSGNSSRGSRAVRWDVDGTPTELEGLGFSTSGSSNSTAKFINEAGLIAGTATKYVGGTAKGDRAVRWDIGSNVATELGNLGTNASGSVTMDVIAINDLGSILGVADMWEDGVNQGTRAVRWDIDTTIPLELEILGEDVNGRSLTFAFDINNANIAVGYAFLFDDDGAQIGTDPHAIAWMADGSAFDLNSFINPLSGWTLTQAYSISNSGFITGVGNFDPDGSAGALAAYSRTFTIEVPEYSVVPEPTSVALLISSFGWLGFRRRRWFRREAFRQVTHAQTPTNLSATTTTRS